MLSLLLSFCLTGGPLRMADSSQPAPYFIAMEYKGMSNCIYKVLVNDSLVIGIKVNGYISVENNFGVGKTIPRESIHSPAAYVDKEMESRYPDPWMNLMAFIHADKDNFVIRRSDIKSVSNNPAKKFGMGYYPYGGRIHLESIKTEWNLKSSHDLILVGDQNPEEILQLFKR